MKQSILVVPFEAFVSFSLKREGRVETLQFRRADLEFDRTKQFPDSYELCEGAEPKNRCSRAEQAGDEFANEHPPTLGPRLLAAFEREPVQAA